VHCQLDDTDPFGTTGGKPGTGGTPGTGTTCLANLAPLCAAHHNLKHHTRIGLAKLPDGTMQWITATGKVITVRPTNLLGGEMLHRGSPRGSPGGSATGSGSPNGGKSPPDAEPPPNAAWNDASPPDGYPF